ncbi:MAG: hypothetical protein M1821_008887 [Bathelium mastoideum]|nr:MAG: hypothetical protein M1821_008887 [Bathelium mastoideum]
MIGGTVLVCICLLALGWTTEIIEFFAPGDRTNGSRIIVLAVLSIYGVDFAINAVQASCRSLIVDTLPTEKQQTGSAWAARMAAVGHLVGYVLGSMDLQSIFGNLLGDTQFKQVVLIAALGLIVSIGLTCWAVTEKVLVPQRFTSTDDLKQDSPFAIFRQILKTTWNLPKRMRAICWIQFWSWIGWFPFLFYSTTWVGEIYLQQQASKAGIFITDALADVGRIGSTSLVIFSAIMLTGSFLLPLLVGSPEDSVSPSPGLPPSRSQGMVSANRYRPSLLTVWTFSNILFALMLMATPFVDTMRTATLVVAMCGLPWTVAIWAPFAFMGVEINTLSSRPLPYTPIRSSESLSITLVDSQMESAAKRHLLDDGHGGVEETAGVYLGILNLFTTLPQFVGTFVSMIVFWILEPGKDPELAPHMHNHHASNAPNAIAVCMFVGGVSALMASHLTQKLKRMK